MAYALLLCTVLPLFAGCESTDDRLHEFIYGTDDGKYNAIEMTIDEDNFLVWYMDLRYGLWTRDGERSMIVLDYIPATQGGGELEIFQVTKMDYYRSVTAGYEVPSAGTVIFSGGGFSFPDITLSEDGRIVTFPPEKIYYNELFDDPMRTVVMEKVLLPAEEIPTAADLIAAMQFVPAVYLDFATPTEGARFACDTVGFWADATTGIGEWITNGTAVPIRLTVSDKVPYMEIYDIGGDTEKRILAAYATPVDADTLEITAIEQNDMLYTTPAEPLILQKQAKE